MYFFSGWSRHETLTGHICWAPQVTEISLGARHHRPSFFPPSEQLHGHLLWAAEKDWVSVSNTHTLRQVSGLAVFHKRKRDGLQTARHVGLRAKIEYCTTSESQSVAAPCQYKSSLWAASLTLGGWCMICFTVWGRASRWKWICDWGIGIFGKKKYFFFFLDDYLMLMTWK